MQSSCRILRPLSGRSVLEVRDVQSGANHTAAGAGEQTDVIAEARVEFAFQSFQHDGCPDGGPNAAAARGDEYKSRLAAIHVFVLPTLRYRPQRFLTVYQIGFRLSLCLSSQEIVIVIESLVLAPFACLRLLVDAERMRVIVFQMRKGKFVSMVVTDSAAVDQQRHRDQQYQGNILRAGSPEGQKAVNGVSQP